MGNGGRSLMDLRTIPLFAMLSDASLQKVSDRLRLREYAAGQAILRAGDVAVEMHIVVKGAAHVELDDGAGRPGRRAILASGQVFGEMSVLSGNPVSATVIAQRDTATLSITAEELSTLLQTEPALYRSIAALLIERLRHRTQARGTQLQPGVAILVVEAAGNAEAALVRAVARGVAYYSPGSELVDAQQADTPALRSQIERWRKEAAGGQFLVIAVAAERFAKLRSFLAGGDAALCLSRDKTLASAEESFDAGLADAETILIDAPAPYPSAARWTQSIMSEEIAACSCDDGTWERGRYPGIDRLARFITYREVGVAMSVGAAAGYAHLGFLNVLQDSGAPIDFICGSSMGGAVALAFGQFGNASAATDALCKLGAAFAKSRGFQVLPRAGLVSTLRMENIAREMFGERTFAQLLLPAAVVAADLVAGQRVILDRGPIAEAARATVAIPGLFPPVRMGARILVDGGLVTRVPVDLLVQRRCGLRIAAVVLPDSPTSQLDAEAERLQLRLDRPFGFRAAVAASWKLLGWWDSAAQAQKADLVVKIPTPGSGFDFAEGRRMVDHGRQATLDQIESIGGMVRKLLAPGLP
jgi:NTE family protein